MLDPEVEAVLAQADETAERIATLGGTPDGRADAIVRNRTWKSFDAEGRVGTEEYLKALIEYYDAFIADDRKAIAELDELDVISSNIIQDHVQELEKFQCSCALTWHSKSSIPCSPQRGEPLSSHVK